MQRSWLLVLFAVPVMSPAYSGGGPYAHTGAFGEPTCEASGCHTSSPYPNAAGSVRIDVGPYVPGQKQRILITIVDPGARRWGFQMAARQARNPQAQAGTFSVVPDDTFVKIRCADDTMQPCVNQLEYASHTSLGTRLGSPSGYTRFSVDWTAPSSDVGNVIFTAAGMGSDGDQTPLGDHTYLTQAVSLFAPSNQPALNNGGVVSAASYSAFGGISQGSLVALFGTNLAPPGFQRQVSATDLDPITGKLPIELNRTGADFFLPGADPIPAYILFVSDKQMNVQVPALPFGFTGPVQVQPVFNRGQGANEVRGNKVSAIIQPISPALFTFDGTSAAAVTPSGAPVGRVGQFPNSRPARPGDIILVYGTGFGATNPPVDPGSLAPGGPAPLVGSFSVRIGSLTLAASDVLYAGAAPGFAGLFQFNLRIPNGLGSGDLPIVISAGSFQTQSGVVLSVQQ
jgi:uncharacterized protein (TIGR03437 family)